MARVSAPSEPPAVVRGRVVAVRAHRRAHCQTRDALWPKPEESGLSLGAAAIAATAGIVVFFIWANRQTAKAHARSLYTESDTWDLFLAWPINDPYFESIRLECVRVCQEYPPAPWAGTSTKKARSALPLSWRTYSAAPRGAATLMLSVSSAGARFCGIAVLPHNRSSAQGSRSPCRS